MLTLEIAVLYPLAPLYQEVSKILEKVCHNIEKDQT